ncbi:hypothetical protein [Tuwongella immobilis]|uniref:Uncharacterized protein n=1 Tax=Tuwongella immobilis TaxID=692036 RepID=A0A6C2YRQ7_9BACT|nr:hypothetical protein [Tuwongella immobilis]VIP04338.1 unnamed protein product [Tuwongella immobilis]VTS06038.1 unnamed protein product [Tuwongella immobilis]
MRTKRLTLAQRREIFHDLVVAQDAKTMSVAETKRAVLMQHQISAAQLEEIVDEGVEKEWPPLNETVSAVG